MKGAHVGLDEAGEALRKLMEGMDGVTRSAGLAAEAIANVNAAASASTSGFRSLATAVKENDGSFGGLIDTMTRISAKWQSATWIQPLITQLEQGQISMQQFRDSSQQVLDGLDVFFGQWMRNANGGLMDELTMLNKAIEEAEKIAKQKAIDAARETFLAIREQTNKNIKEWLAEHPTDKGSTGSQSFDANGNPITNEGGSGSSLGTGGTSKLRDALAGLIPPGKQ